MTPAEIAGALWDVRMRGGTIELDAAARPADTAAAYAIQGDPDRGVVSLTFRARGD